MTRLTYERVANENDEKFRREIKRLLDRCRSSLRARAEVRAKHDLIYVRTHVVKAYFRRATKKKRR